MKKSVVLKSVVPIVILLGGILIMTSLIGARKPPEKEVVEEKAFLVDAQPIFRQNVNFNVFSQGNVQPKHKTQVSTQVSGRIVSMSDAFVVGGMFKKGDVLLTIEQDDYVTDVQLAEAELARAEAALQEEVASGKVAEEEWRSVNSVVPPELGLRKPQLAREQANVKAARASLERAKRNLQRTQVVAPYNGIVTQRNVDLGQFLPVGSNVGEVFSTDVAEVRLSIPDRDLGYIDIDAGVAGGNNVRLSAIVAGKQRFWDAKLKRTEGVLDQGNRVVYVVAEVSDPYHQTSNSTSADILRFGQFVQAEISGTDSSDLYVLPRSVLRLDNTVIVVNGDREIQIKPVDVVRTDTNAVYISGGLAPGDLVARTAVPNPFNGMKVRLPGDEPEIEEPAKNDQPDDKESITQSEGE